MSADAGTGPQRAWPEGHLRHRRGPGQRGLMALMARDALFPPFRGGEGAG